MNRGLRTLLGLVLLGAAGCAHVEAPSGGPQDSIPPALVASRPAAGSVTGAWRGPVVLLFSERVSERGIDQAVEVSPRTSGVVVRHSGDELRVGLREGWLPGIIYQVNVQPGLQDLFSNPITGPIRLVFSTGPEIPETLASGTVVDRTNREPLPELRVEAIRTTDSLVYATVTDSAGRFSIANVPEGDYLVRSFEDMDANRALDDFEPRDTASATIAIGDPAEIRLSVVLPDSTAPRVGTAVLDGRVVTVSFDDFLDPARIVPVEDVTVVGPSGERVPVARVALGGFRAPADTAAAAPVDTVRPDTVPADTVPAAPVDTAAAPPPADTAAAEPLPSQELAVELAEGVVLQPGAEYTITIRNVRNIVGLAADATTTFTVPAAPAGDVASAPEGALIAENPN